MAAIGQGGESPSFSTHEVSLAIASPAQPLCFPMESRKVAEGSAPECRASERAQLWLAPLPKKV